VTRKLLLTFQLLALAAAPAAAQGTEFARVVNRLSEPGGYFDSDNLVSNETSYLHVLPALRALGVQGGVYLGVGPEQSFSYIAEIKPELAILIDIRRDNMLLHLLLKTMFEVSRNRMEYLCLLYGRPAPQVLARWTDQPLEDILTYLDITPVDTAAYAQSHEALMERVTRLGVALTDTDRVTLRRFHDEFVGEGLEITFSSRGRMGRRGYPNERQLYLATDLEDKPGSYLATEERFRVVRDMQRSDRIIPVVGDLSGPTAMKAIAAYLKELKLQVSAFYVSNVEMYLFRQGNFGKYAENVHALPAGASSIIIRSYFGRGMMWNGGGTVGSSPFPQALPGHLSAQQLQPFPVFLALTEHPDAISYLQLLTTGTVDLQAPAPVRPPDASRSRRPGAPHRVERAA
jgi:hypothetical protein